MKKRKIIIPAIALAILLIYILLPKVIIKSSEAVLVYQYDSKDIKVQLTEEEAAEVKKMFNWKILLFDEPSCGYSEDVSIRFGDQIFSIAGDGCPGVMLENKGMYVYTSEKDTEKIHELFEKYGGSFPCV
jgi:uncharacterized protein YbbK (DUF523 family)